MLLQRWRGAAGGNPIGREQPGRAVTSAAIAINRKQAS